MTETLTKAQLDSMLALYGIKKKQLADELSVTPTYLSRITPKTGTIKPQHAEKIMNAIRKIMLRRTLQGEMTF